MRCLGCGGEFREMDGPTHPYVLSSAGCWAAYGELLALEYEDRTYAVVNRLSVDTYAVQHPGIDRGRPATLSAYTCRGCV